MTSDALRQLLAAGCALVALGASATGGAYQYIDDGGSCPDGVTWAESDRPVPYHINQQTAPELSLSEVETAFDKSFEEWESVCCTDFAGSYQGSTSQTVEVGGSTNNSSQHVVDWEESSWPQQLGNSIAVALLRYNSCEFGHVDMLFNGVETDWNTSGTINSSTIDVRAVATHEVGHLLGLVHSSIEEATMYEQLQDLSQRTLHSDDEAGVCYLYPDEEVCNGEDDDCDGSVDEGNLTKQCPKQEGVCSGASVSCSDGSYPTCTSSTYGSNYESPESSCDGLDNDCDGSVDEGLTRDCSLQEGVCSGTTVACENGSFSQCDSEQYGSSYETDEASCDGLDNDCDGSVDEGLTRDCSLQEGVCSGATVACENGSFSQCDSEQYGSSYETDETSCDGRDNDCDGSVDEGLTQRCSLQEGVCSGATVACENGSFSQCDSEQYGSSYETDEASCDGRDNDCDGRIDEMLRQTYWRDRDGDGYGAEGESTMSCPPAPGGYVDNKEDCAPEDPSEPGSDGTCESATDVGVVDAGETGTSDTGDAGTPDTDEAGVPDTSDGAVTNENADTADDVDDAADDAVGGDASVKPEIGVDGAERTDARDADSSSGSVYRRDRSGSPASEGCGCASRTASAGGNWLAVLFAVGLLVGWRVLFRRRRIDDRGTS